MDTQGQQPSSPAPGTPPQAPPTSAPPTLNNVQPQPVSSSEQGITDKDAQALLAITGSLSAQKNKSKLPMSLIITIIVLIVIVVMTTFLLGNVGKGGKLNNSNLTGSGSTAQNQGSGSNIHNQINQDVKSCSNPVNAVTEC